MKNTKIKYQIVNNIKSIQQNAVLANNTIKKIILTHMNEIDSFSNRYGNIIHIKVNDGKSYYGILSNTNKYSITILTSFENKTCYLDTLLELNRLSIDDSKYPVNFTNQLISKVYILSNLIKHFRENNKEYGSELNIYKNSISSYNFIYSKTKNQYEEIYHNSVKVQNLYKKIRNNPLTLFTNIIKEINNSKHSYTSININNIINIMNNLLTDLNKKNISLSDLITSIDYRISSIVK